MCEGQVGLKAITPRVTWATWVTWVTCARDTRVTNLATLGTLRHTPPSTLTPHSHTTLHTYTHTHPYTHLNIHTHPTHVYHPAHTYTRPTRLHTHRSRVTSAPNLYKSSTRSQHPLIVIPPSHQTSSHYVLTTFSLRCYYVLITFLRTGSTF